jgi:hypothetical protein
MKPSAFPLWLLPAAILGLAVVSVAAVFLAPISAQSAAHWRAAASVAPVFLLVGAGAVFLSGLKTFKTAMRSAYRLLAIGMLLFSLLFIQVAIWGLFDLWDTLWATSGSGIAPVVLTTTMFYIASRKMAGLLQIKSLLRNLWFVIGASLAVGVGMAMFAASFVAYDIPGTSMYIGVVSWGSMNLAIATILVYKAYRAIGPSYHQAMRWLVISVALFALASWHEAINTLWFNNGSTYTDYGYYLLPWTVAGLIMLYASYKFKQLPFVSGIGSAQTADITDQDYIDSVLAVAQLASRPEDIDGMLDDLRGVTATRQPDQPLSHESRQRLLRSYYQLEAYLREKDPVRMVSYDEIQASATPAFRSLLAQKTNPSSGATPAMDDGSAS